MSPEQAFCPSAEWIADRLADELAEWHYGECASAADPPGDCDCRDPEGALALYEVWRRGGA